ncbi:MAG: hypothetical protein MK085_07730 [Phycisphaerales bacterium]|nr:hypothetical protein [Phycisphaerales bacterium]
MTGRSSRDMIHVRRFAVRSPRAVAGRLVATCLGVLLGLHAGLQAAPPEFACAGLVPEDVSVVVRFDPREPHARAWFARLEDLAAISVGDEPAGQWRDIHAFCERLAGGEAAESMLAIRAPQGESDIDWVLATRLQDHEACAEGLRQAGARMLGGGRFSLPEGGLEIRPLRAWLLAAPDGSRLLGDVEERAAVDDVASRDPGFSDLVSTLPRAAVEVVYRHPSPVDGRTAAAISPTSEHDAEVTLSGRYLASPLPVRGASSIDLRWLPDLGRRATMAMHESGVGVLDPMLIQLAAGMPALMPPADVRKTLAAERIVVFDGEAVRLEGRGLYDVPAVCVIIPFRAVMDQEPLEDAAKSMDAWMTTVGRVLRNAFDPTGSEAEEAAPTIGRGGVRHLALGPGLVGALRGHPVGLATSLNWTTCGNASGQHWFVVATTPGLVNLVGRTLSETAVDPVEGVEVGSAGIVQPEALALQVEDLARIRAEQGDDSARSDAALMNSLARMLSRLSMLEWRMSRQDIDAIEGTVRIQIAPTLSSEASEP